MTDIHVDTSDFFSFARALREAEPVLARELARGLRGAGQIVAQKAKEYSSESLTVPPSIKVKVSGGVISVVAGGTGVPLAGLLELGGAGNTEPPPSWRHPVFGNKEVWVDQPTKPYLAPALSDNMLEADRAAQEALDLAIIRAVE